MKLSKLGRNTSIVEISGISPFGIWVFVQEHEYFMNYDEFPWFKNATVAQIYNVDLVHGRHLYWKDLDVDLAIESLSSPEKFPLVSKR